MATKNNKMDNKYCTYLTVYFGDVLPRRYIGSSTIAKIKKGYNGSVSSKRWKSIYKEEQNNNKHLFRTKIISVHDSSYEARKHELVLQKRYNVVKNPLYINESFCRPNGYFGRNVSGVNNPMYGKSHPNKGKNINSGNRGEKNPMHGLKGVNHPAYGYKRSDETNMKTAESLRGTKKSEEHVKNMKKSKASDNYKNKINKPIYVCGVPYKSIKIAIETSGKTHSFIWSRLKKPDNTEVYYI